MLVFLSIDEKLSDAINIFAIVVSIAGFLFLSYEFFPKGIRDKKQKRGIVEWILRISLPVLVGIFILAPVGWLRYFYAHDMRALAGALAYGLVGAIIGAFNGIFVEWPLSETSPTPAFRRRDALVGFFISSPTWAVVGYIFRPSASIAQLLFIGGSIGAVSAVFAGFWSSLSWEPPSLIGTSQHPAQRSFAPVFSWGLALLGLVCGFLLAFAPGVILGAPQDGAIIGAVLGALGGCIGGFWPGLGREPFVPGTGFSWFQFNPRRGLFGLVSGLGIPFVVSFFFGAPLMGAFWGTILAPAASTVAGFWDVRCPAPQQRRCFSWRAFRWKRGFLRLLLRGVIEQPRFSWRAFCWKRGLLGLLLGGVIGGILAYAQGITLTGGLIPGECLAVTGFLLLGLWPTPASAGQSQLAAPPSGLATSPPLFSAGGLFLGLVTALLFGCLLISVTELVFGHTWRFALGAAFENFLFIGLAGALIGAFSRYFFSWAASYDRDKSLGIGTVITLFGFCLQLIPLVFNLF